VVAILSPGAQLTISVGTWEIFSASASIDRASLRVSAEISVVQETKPPPPMPAACSSLRRGCRADALPLGEV
jgi:hypothetical protein